MPNCHFYAARTDFLPILEYVFESDDFVVYELYSEFEKELQRFKSIDEIAKHFRVRKWGNALKLGMWLQLHPYKAGGKVLIERVSVAPEFCNGATYRYKTRGWGLIQLYLGGECKQAIHYSSTNHNSERRALAYASMGPELGKVSDWDWGEVVRCSRRLNYQIRKLSVRVIRSSYVLPEAKALLSSGFKRDG